MEIGCNAISCNRKQYEMRMITQCVKDRHKLNTTVNRKEETEKKKSKPIANAHTSFYSIVGIINTELNQTPLKLKCEATFPHL